MPLNSLAHSLTRILSLPLSFFSLASVDLTPGANSANSISIASSHNLPIPPPLFDLQLHLQPIQSTQTTLLFNNPDDLKPIDGHFSTGLVVKVGVVGDKGFVLGGFSEDARKVLSKQDFLFFTSFASDLSKHIALL